MNKQSDFKPQRIDHDIRRAVTEAQPNKLLSKESKCDCLPGQCTKEAQYCKDWNKRGGK